MDWGILVLVLFVAACPISMMWMMRRKHGGHGRGMHGGGAHEGATPDANPEERLSELERTSDRRAGDRGTPGSAASATRPPEVDRIR